MKKWSMLSALLLVMLFSCSDGGSSDSGGRAQSTSQSNIQFTLPEPVGVVSSARALDNSQPTHLLVIDVNAENPEIMEVPIVPGDNSISVDKNGFYIFQFIQKPTDSGVPILKLGSLTMATVNVDALVLGEDAADDIILGNLQYQDGSYQYDVPMHYLEQNSGLSRETILSIGNLDDQLKKLLNPDIDHNGVLDSAQDLNWIMNLFYRWVLSASDITLSDGISGFTPSLFSNSSPDLIFSIGGLDIVENAISFQFPQDNPIVNSSSQQPITSMALNYNGMIYDNGVFSNSNGIGDYQGMFPAGTDPTLPVNGDYTISYGSKILYMDDLYFYTPEQGFEDFVFPLIEILKHEDGSISEIHWKWFQVSNGQLQPADTNLSSVVIDQFYFKLNSSGTEEFYDPTRFGYELWQDGMASFTQGAMHCISDENLANHLVTYEFWDVFNNSFSVSITE